MRAVLADTGPLYAAVDPDDHYHERAQKQLQALEDEGLSIVLAYPALLEAYTLILYRLGHPTTSRWLEDVRAGTTLLNPTPLDYREATVLVGRFPDQSISLFDATISFALPARGRLAAAREIGQRCGATWFEHGVGDLPEGIPDELEDWSEQCRRTWRSGLV